MASDIALSDYSALTITGTGSFDGAYTRNANQFSLDGDTAFSGNALFNANSGYYYFIKDGDNTTAVIYSEGDTAWAAVAKAGFDFSTIADNDPLGSPNSVSTFGNDSTAYENGVNQPTANATFVYGGSNSPIGEALAGKEPTITAGTTSQYWRGDKSWQTLDQTAVGLANVDDTSDADKPVSTAQQTALDAKASSATLASNANGDGASLIGIEDADGRYNATEVEGALAEVKALADQNSLGLGAFWGEVVTAATSNV
ncbi:MAG: hypothetical protein PUP46_07875, partial [Endozoicomonas sp. (ex Botrylloides leachii)]|nr:hypothetical protein [Endozoicomonas sp. (ex Botrylloides leachii)]